MTVEVPQHNLATVHEAIASRVPDRECIVYRDRRHTYADITDRTRRLAHALRDRGLHPRPEGSDGLADTDPLGGQLDAQRLRQTEGVLRGLVGPESGRRCKRVDPVTVSVEAGHRRSARREVLGGGAPDPDATPVTTAARTTTTPYLVRIDTPAVPGAP